MKYTDSHYRHIVDLVILRFEHKNKGRKSSTLHNLKYKLYEFSADINEDGETNNNNKLAEM